MAKALVLVTLKLLEAGLSPKQANDLIMMLLEDELV